MINKQFHLCETTRRAQRNNFFFDFFFFGFSKGFRGSAKTPFEGEGRPPGPPSSAQRRGAVVSGMGRDVYKEKGARGGPLRVLRAWRPVSGMGRDGARLDAPAPGNPF